MPRVAPVVDQAVCVRQWDWSETSQTVSLFSREHGLIRALAKGSRRPRAPFSGGLEVATLGEMVALLKPAPGLATLTAWDLREAYPVLRRSLSAFYGGMYAADVAQHVVQERDPHPALFDALVAALRALTGEARADRLAVLRLQWAALAETGLTPALDRDVVRGGRLEERAVYAFASHLGGLTAAAAPRVGRGDRPPWRVRAETVKVLRAIAAGSSVDGAADAAVVRAGRLLAAHLREILGRDAHAAHAVFGPIGIP